MFERAEAHPRVESGEQGFDSVSEQRGLTASAGFLLTPAQSEIAAQLQLAGTVQEMIGIDKMGAQL